MKTKLIGLVALAFAFTLMAAQQAAADGIHGAQDSDDSAPQFHADFSNSPVHAYILKDDLDRDNNGYDAPTFDHIVAHSFVRPVPDCGCDQPPTPAPEPSSLLLMAVGLTPLLWVRRRTLSL